MNCPTCGKDTAASEEWSTGQCDDCYAEDHEPACGSTHGCIADYHFLPCPEAAQFGRSGGSDG